MKSILTVTVAADGFNLTTREAVKLDLGITANDELAWIDAKLPRASGAIARYCRRTFARQTYSELFRPERDRAHRLEALRLSHYPVASITSVTVDGTVLSATGYELDAATGLVYRLCNDSRTCWAGCKITVVYIAGYTLPGVTGRDLPQDIEEAAIMLIKSARAAKTRDPALKSIDLPGVMSATYWIGDAPEEALPPEVCALLQPYVKLDR